MLESTVPLVPNSKKNACHLETTPHDLLRVLGAADLVSSTPVPEWVHASLDHAPFVVVRRARQVGGLIPVGVRGRVRNQRFSAWLPFHAMQGQTKPEQISKKRTWRSTGQFLSSSILSTLSEASELLENFGLIWGPTGSIGFELASGIATAVASSDVDILIRIPHRFPIAQAQFIRNSLTRMPVVVDVQIETPLGAVALGEYARGSKTILLRTLEGPRLVADPWKDTPDGTGTT